MQSETWLSRFDTSGSDLRRSKVPGGRVALADPPVPLWKLVHPLGLA